MADNTTSPQEQDENLINALWQLGGSVGQMPHHKFMDAFGLNVFTRLHALGWTRFDLTYVFITDKGREVLKKSE